MNLRLLKKYLPLIIVAVVVIVAVIIILKFRNSLNESEEKQLNTTLPPSRPETSIIENVKLDILMNGILIACQRLQASVRNVPNGEIPRNNFISSLLSQKFIVKDNPLWGVSASGKKAGEPDMIIENANGFVEGIIEALNLSYVAKKYTSVHWDKIFNYDVNGLPRNYILVYSMAKTFSQFSKKYSKYLSEHTFKYPVVGPIIDISQTSYGCELNIFVSKHIRNGVIVELYHFLLNMNQ